MAELFSGGEYAGTPAVFCRSSFLCGPDAGDDVVLSEFIFCAGYVGGTPRYWKLRPLESLFTLLGCPQVNAQSRRPLHTVFSVVFALCTS